MIEEKSSCNGLWANADKLPSVIFVQNYFISVCSQSSDSIAMNVITTWKYHSLKNTDDSSLANFCCADALMFNHRFKHFMSINVNVDVYSLKSPWVQQTNYNLHPWYWNSLLFCLISSGENLAHFLQLMAFTIFHFFVPPGTH